MICFTTCLSPESNSKDNLLYYTAFTQPLLPTSLMPLYLAFSPNSRSVAEQQAGLQSGVKQVCWESLCWAELQRTLFAPCWQTHTHTHTHTSPHTRAEQEMASKKKKCHKLYTLVTHTKVPKYSHIGYMSESQAAVCVALWFPLKMLEKSAWSEGAVTKTGGGPLKHFSSSCVKSTGGV